MRITLLFGILLLASVSIPADPLSRAETEALQATQKILLDPSKLLDAAQKNPGGEEALRQLNKVAGSPENADLMLRLASDILSSIVLESGGDPEKLEAIVVEIARDPKKLESRLTESQRKSLGSLASKIEARQKKIP